VTIESTQRDWATFLTSCCEQRRLPTREIRLEGKRPEVRRFVKAFIAELT
jgi:hypothetical protein